MAVITALEVIIAGCWLQTPGQALLPNSDHSLAALLHSGVSSDLYLLHAAIFVLTNVPLDAHRYAVMSKSELIPPS